MDGPPGPPTESVLPPAAAEGQQDTDFARILHRPVTDLTVLDLRRIRSCAT